MEKAAADPREFHIDIGWAHMLGAALGVGIFGFIVALPLFYFKAEMHQWGKLLACSAGVGLFTALVLRSRGGGKQKRVTVNAEGVKIENERDRILLPWSEIEQVNHWVHGDHYWEFVSPHRAQPVVLKGFGFGKDECARLSEVLKHYKPVVEESVGAKRILEDAFVH
ncbi:MAG TPA: hypothetical protein VNU68_30490 [Verrucomicrobiae bacterium]|jgi:hypothetical protein|nr:hypothetical protein [Verrucomicrobiae bacterium]